MRPGVTGRRRSDDHAAREGQTASRTTTETTMTDQKTAIPMPAGMPSLDEVQLQSNDMPWRAKSLPGVSEKMLWRDEQGGSSIALIKFDKGASIPQPHLHASNQFMFCLRESTNTPRPASR